MRRLDLRKVVNCLQRVVNPLHHEEQALPKYFEHHWKMQAQSKTARFSLRTALAATALAAITLTLVRYFVFPPPLSIQIEPIAAWNVPPTRAFKVDGELIGKEVLHERLADHAETTLGRFRRGRVLVVLPPNSEPGCCAEALDLIGDAAFEAGFANVQVVRNAF